MTLLFDGALPSQIRRDPEPPRPVIDGEQRWQTDQYDRGAWSGRFLVPADVVAYTKFSNPLKNILHRIVQDELDRQGDPIVQYMFRAGVTLDKAKQIDHLLDAERTT